MNELSTVLISIISTLAGSGGIAGLLFWRQSRRLKESEARLAEVSVKKAEMEAQNDQWQIFKEEYEAVSRMNLQLIERNEKLVAMNAEKEDRHQQDLNEKEDRFCKQTEFLRDIQRELVDALEREKGHIRENARIQRERDHYFNWRCFREFGGARQQCLRRKPKQKVPIKYIPLEGIEEEEMTTEENTEDGEV